jgi:hypothetical protein
MVVSVVEAIALRVGRDCGGDGGGIAIAGRFLGIIERRRGRNLLDRKREKGRGIQG